MTKQKKLYQKVNNKPKKFGNNNVNSINIILGEHDREAIQKQKGPGPGAGSQVIQELSRIKPPSLEDARQILGRTVRDEKTNMTVDDIRNQGVQTEVAEVIDNARVAQETQTENEAYAEQIASQQDALGALAEIAIQTDPIDTADDEEMLMQQYHRDMDNQINSLEQERDDDVGRIQSLSEMIEGQEQIIKQIVADATYQTAGNLGEIVRNNLAGRVAQNMFNSPPPRDTPPWSDLRFATPPRVGGGPLYTPTAPRGNNLSSRVQNTTQQVPLAASFNSQFAQGTDVPERANRPTRPRPNKK